MVMTCMGCGEELSEERAQLGYRYCTKDACQAQYRRGVTITTVGVNKSADSFVVADSDEVRRRGEAGEFGRKDSALGLDYRRRTAGRARATRPPRPAQVPAPRKARPPWTAEQETLVRLYQDMGLSPRQIAERARANAPRLNITERLAVQIMSAPRRR